MKGFYYGKQHIDDIDVESVSLTLQSDVISQGPKLKEFENSAAEYCGARYCVAVSNGTAGLHLACKALGLEKGDIGWTSPLSFVASANCIRYCGAEVDFIDINLNTFNISPETIKEKFNKAKKENRLPKVLIPVHFAGLSCNMQELKNIADQYGCKIIEDACQALGGEYDSKKIGSCLYSDITVFSLHPVKSITTGEGGLVMTNNGELYEKVKLMRAHGIMRASGNNSGHTKDP
jgi:dTDP-4-amino-4,6-dideoxygalactose transaminase